MGGYTARVPAHSLMKWLLAAVGIVLAVLVLVGATVGTLGVVKLLALALILVAIAIFVP